ncbi:MAG: polysaccharide pyruvyl transferase CsaB [Firmicutes bacterium]|nr:polysaccharide pyruvyl transferase CsaB [Bacillota bacterium]
MKVLAAGYFGCGNVGDEAILAGLARELALAGAELTVLSGDPEGTRASHGLPAVHRLSLEALKALRSCDVFVLGGGGLFQDVTSIRSPLYYLSLVLLARIFRRRVHFFAQGLGPLETLSGRLAAGVALRLAHRVSLRDEESLELARQLAPELAGRVSADPAFLLRPPQPPRPGSLLVISLRAWPGLEGKLDEIASAVDSFCGGSELEPLFLPFQPRDREISLKAAGLLGARVWEGELDVPAVLEVLEKAGLCLGMRLHSLILAACLGVPGVGLIYDPKVAAFLRISGQEGLPIEGIQRGELLKLLDRAWKDREQRRRDLILLGEALQKRAKLDVQGILALAGEVERAGED